MPRGMSWHNNNDSLVESGRVVFDLGFGRHWNDELEGMNREKRGRPYEFPDSYIEFLSLLKQGVGAFLGGFFVVSLGLSSLSSQSLALCRSRWVWCSSHSGRNSG